MISFLIGLFWFVTTLVAGLLYGRFVCNVYDAEYPDNRLKSGMRLKFVLICMIVALVLYLPLLVIREWFFVILVLLIIDAFIQLITLPKKVTVENVAASVVLIKAVWYFVGVLGWIGLIGFARLADGLVIHWGNKALGIPTLLVIYFFLVACAYYAGSFRMRALREEEKLRGVVIRFVIVIVILLIMMYYFIISASMGGK